MTLKTGKNVVVTAQKKEYSPNHIVSSEISVFRARRNPSHRFGVVVVVHQFAGNEIGDLPSIPLEKLPQLQHAIAIPRPGNTPKNETLACWVGTNEFCVSRGVAIAQCKRRKDGEWPSRRQEQQKRKTKNSRFTIAANVYDNRNV